MPALDQGRVEGTVELGSELPDVTAATVEVYLEEVSRADDDAVAMGHQSIRGVSHRGGRSTTVRFVILGGPVDPGMHYAVRAHVHCHEGTAMRVGDFISVQGYPVLTFGNPATVAIAVREIKSSAPIGCRPRR